MQLSRRALALATTVLAAGAMFAGALGATAAQAAFPERQVTIVVPFPPGGGTDTGTRLLAQKLQERWGQPVVVENKPGAAGAIGADIVARAKPDGYTLLMGNFGTQSINPILYPKLPYNPDTAFSAVSLVAELPQVLVVHPDLPAKDPAELVALAKGKPGELMYSSSGNGGSMHLAGALFEDAAGAKLVHVPYKGGGPAIQDLIGGHVNLSFATILESSGFIKAGKLRALAVTSAARSPALPEVPTLAETALPGFNAISWIGLLAPAGTPQEILDKVSADVRKAVLDSGIKDQLIAQGATPVGSSPAEFQALIDSDRKRYAEIIKQKGITAN